jgi:phage terminase large subunit-like protein
VRAWDLAATPKDEGAARDPDWTARVRLGKAADRTLYVLDVRRLRGSPREVEALVLHTAATDGPGTHVVMEQEPGTPWVPFPPVPGAFAPAVVTPCGRGKW